MGIIYDVVCPSCGRRFEHLAGLGMMYACIGCGEESVPSRPFFCPHCAKKIDPKEPSFESYASASSLWE